MIFVTVGSSKIPFDRLLAAVAGISPNLVVQSGPSAVSPEGAECVPFMTFPELTAAVERADVVVTHAGVGSIMVALMYGKRPLVVPRLRRFGEAVDDHQVPFARRLAEEGIVELVEDPRDLRAAVSGVASNGAKLHEDGNLIHELRSYVLAHIDPGLPPER